MRAYVPRHAISHRSKYGRGATWHINRTLRDARRVVDHIVRDAARRLTTDALAEYGFAGSKLTRAESQKMITATQNIIARDIRNLIDSLDMLP